LKEINLNITTELMRNLIKTYQSLNDKQGGKGQQPI